MESGAETRERAESPFCFSLGLPVPRVFVSSDALPDLPLRQYPGALCMPTQAMQDPKR